MALKDRVATLVVAAVLALGGGVAALANHPATAEAQPTWHGHGWGCHHVFCHRWYERGWYRGRWWDGGFWDREDCPWWERCW